MKEEAHPGSQVMHIRLVARKKTIRSLSLNGDVSTAMNKTIGQISARNSQLWKQEDQRLLANASDVCKEGIWCQIAKRKASAFSANEKNITLVCVHGGLRKGRIKKE